jgi:predicted Fe-Mo cluster-binding NifX family protein
VLLCTDITRLARRLSPEVVTALRDAGVRVVTADRGELGFPDLVAQALTITETEIGNMVKQETK